MENSVSQAGINLNLINKSTFTVGLRKDGNTNKSIGVRPNSSDNHDYQFELTFDKLVTNNTTILNSDLYTTHTLNDNRVDLSDNTMLTVHQTGFKHCINIDNLTDELFIAQYTLDYTGYTLSSNYNTCNGLIIKGINVVDNDPIDDEDLDTRTKDYVWIDNNIIQSSDSNVENILNELYPNPTKEQLETDLSILSEPIYWSTFANMLGLNENVKIAHGKIKFNANTFLTDKLFINQPVFMDNNNIPNETTGQHAIIIDSDTKLRYFKLPTVETILYKLVGNNKWLDVSESLTGGVTYTSKVTDTISDGNLCLLSTNLYNIVSTESIDFPNGGIIAGVSSTTGTTSTYEHGSLPTTYPYLATVESTTIAKLILDSTDRTNLITYADTDDIVYYELTQRTIDLGTSTNSLFSGIGSSGNNVSFLFAYFKMTVGSSGNLVENSNKGIMVTGDIFTDDGIMYNCELESYANLTNTNNNIGGWISYALNMTITNCTHIHTGKINGGTRAGVSFGNCGHATITNFTQTVTAKDPSATDGDQNVLNVTGDQAGVFVARGDYIVINGLTQTVTGSIYSTSNTIGGAVAQGSYATISNIDQKFTGDIKTSTASNSGQYAGGMIGYSPYSGYDSDGTSNGYGISNCSQIFVGNIECYQNSNIGGLIAHSPRSNISNCSQDYTGNVYINIALNGNFSAGCIGRSEHSTISNIHSKFVGDLTMNQYCAGLFGYSRNSFIENCIIDYNGTASFNTLCGMIIGSSLQGSSAVSDGYIKNITVICKGEITGPEDSGVTGTSKFGYIVGGSTKGNVSCINIITSANLVHRANLGLLIGNSWSGDTLYDRINLINIGTITSNGYNYNTVINAGSSYTTTNVEFFLSTDTDDSPSGVTKTSVSSPLTDANRKTIAQNWGDWRLVYNLVTSTYDPEYKYITYPTAFDNSGNLSVYKQAPPIHSHDDQQYDLISWLTTNPYVSDGAGNILPIMEGIGPHNTAAVTTDVVIANPSFEFNETTASDEEHEDETPYGWSSVNGASDGKVKTIYCPIGRANNTWDGVKTNYGGYCVGLKKVGTYIYQTVQVTANVNYVISFYAAKRYNDGSNVNLTVQAGDDHATASDVLASFTVSNTDFVKYTTNSFNTSGTSIVIKFYNSSDSGDKTVFLDNVKMYADFGTVTDMNVSYDTKSYTIEDIDSSYAPSDIITNLSTLQSNSARKGQDLYLNYIPRASTAKNSSARDFKVYGDSDSISSYSSDYDIYLPSSGTLTVGNRTITCTDSAVSVDGTAITSTDIIDVIFGSTTYYYYFINGSLEGGETTSSTETFPPTVSSFTLSDTSLIAGETATVTLVFSEAVAGFDSDLDITTQNGSLSTMTTSNNITWTGTFTPDTDIEDTTNILTLATSYTDTAGNSPLSAVSTDNYEVETLVPTLTSVGISSNNSTSTLAKEGDEITLSFTSSETINTPTVTFESNNVAITNSVTVTNISGDDWTATYTVHSSDTDGSVSFTIDFSDSAGNTNSVNSVTDSSAVTVDMTVPTLTPVSIASNNSTSTLAKEGDVVTLSFTASETIDTPTVVIQSGSASITNSVTVTNTTGDEWTATYTVHTDDTDGAVSFTISNFSDLSGNSGSNVTAVTDSSSVTVDKVSPTIDSITMTSNNSTNTLGKLNDVITLSFSSSETINTPTVTFTDSGTTDLSTDSLSSDGNNWTATHTIDAADDDGLVTFVISNISDTAGNTASNVSTVSSGSNVTIDQTLPTLTPITISTDYTVTTEARINNVITLTFTASETITPTVVIKDYQNNVLSNDTGPTNTSSYIWEVTHTVDESDEDGPISFTIDYSDTAGNDGTQQTSTTDSTFVKINKYPPTLTTVTMTTDNAANTWGKENDTITLAFTSSKQIDTPTVIFKDSGDNTLTNTSGPTNTSGNDWVVTHLVGSGDLDGLVTFTVTDIEDTFENDGEDVTTVTSGSNITIDQTLPSLSSIVMVSNKLVNTIARIQNTITLTFTASELITDVVVVIKDVEGNALSTTTTNPSGYNWETTHTVDENSINGLVSFTIDYEDPANNVGPQVSSVSSGSNVTIEKIDFLTITANNINKVLDIPFTDSSGTTLTDISGNDNNLEFSHLDSSSADGWDNTAESPNEGDNYNYNFGGREYFEKQLSSAWAGSFTIGFWVKPDVDCETNTTYFSSGSSDTNFSITHKDCDWYLYHVDDTYDKKIGDFDDDIWQHVVVAFDYDTNNIYTYFNGIDQEQGNTSNDDFIFNSYKIGMSMDNTSGAKGYMSDFFLFNKVLTAQEVYNLYHFNDIEVNNFGQYIRAKITKNLNDLEKTLTKKIVSLALLNK